MASAHPSSIEKDLYTVGQTASLIKKIDSVKNVLLELQGFS